MAVVPPDEAGDDPLVSGGSNDLEYSPGIMPEGEIPVPMPLGVDSDEEFDPDSFVPVTPPGELAAGAHDSSLSISSQEGDRTPVLVAPIPVLVLPFSVILLRLVCLLNVSLSSLHQSVVVRSTPLELQILKDQGECLV